MEVLGRRRYTSIIMRLLHIAAAAAAMLLATRAAADGGRTRADEVAELLSSLPVEERPVREGLAKTGPDPFPENVRLSFRANAEAAGEGRRSMTILFKQEDVPGRGEAFAGLVREIAGAERRCDVSLIFTALDDPPLPGTRLTGTEAAAERINDADGSFALAVAFGGGETSRLLTGSLGSATPLWLTRFCADSFLRADAPFEMPHALLSLYRLGLLRGDRRMAELIRAGIPAATVELADGGGDSAWTRFVAEFVRSYRPSDSEGGWDIHYIFLKLPRPFRPVWVGERAFLSMTVAVVALCLLLLCGLSFVGRSAAGYKRDLLRSWYVLPLTAALSFGALTGAERVLASFPWAAALPPALQFGAKAAAAMAAVQAAMLLMERLRLPVAEFAHGFVGSMVAMWTVLAFSAVDLTLFGAFAFEYAVMHFFRPARRIPLVLFSLALLSLPFVPYASALARGADEFVLRRIVFCRHPGNGALVLAMFPFHVLWARVFIRIEVASGIGGWRRARSRLTTAAAALFMAAAVTAPFIALQEKVRSARAEPPAPVRLGEIPVDDRGTLRAEISRTEFRGLATNRLSIRTDEDALRIEASVVGTGSAPLYETTYDHEAAADGSARFVLPDLPPRSMTIDYAADADDATTATVTAWFRDGEGFRRETRVVTAGVKEKTDDSPKAGR